MQPRTYVNGQTGERLIFGEYGSDERGDYLEILDGSLPVGSRGPPEHRHLCGDERFAVTEGRLGLRVGADEFTLGPGESATVPAGVVHTWWNAGDTPVVGRGELRNPGRFESLIATTFGLTNAGKVDSQGRPGLLQSAVVLAAVRDEYDPSFLSRPVKVLTFGVLAPIGRALGYRPTYEYVDPAEPVVESSVAD